MGWSQVQAVNKKLGTCINAKFRPSILLLVSVNRGAFWGVLSCPSVDCTGFAHLGLQGPKLGFVCDWTNIWKWNHWHLLKTSSLTDCKVSKAGRLFQESNFCSVFLLILRHFLLLASMSTLHLLVIYGVQQPEPREGENHNLLKKKIIHWSLALPTHQKFPQW